MNVVGDWLETRSRWSGLRDLGQSGLVRASVLMPAFGYLLIMNEHVHAYVSLLNDAGWPFHYFSPMWRIWLLFYGSFSLAAGSLLFARWCPPEIKQHGTAFHLVNLERSHLVAHAQTRDIIAYKLRALYQGMSVRERPLFTMPMLDPDAPNLGAGTSPGRETGDQFGLGLIHIWQISDIKRPNLRAAIFVFFWAGLILLAIPAGVTFVQLTILLATHLLPRFC
jgi:hypothetical protein